MKFSVLTNDKYLMNLAGRIDFYALCPGGPKFDPAQRARVAAAARVNRGIMLGVVHPLFCAPPANRPKPVFREPALDRLIGSADYPAYLARLERYLKAAAGPVLVLAERGRKKRVENWLPALAVPVIFLATREKDPLPSFRRPYLPQWLSSETSCWEFLTGVLCGYGVRRILLAGEKHISYRGKQIGCVPSARYELSRAHLPTQIVQELTFPNKWVDADPPW
jgi:hypothetical protein